MPLYILYMPHILLNIYKRLCLMQTETLAAGAPCPQTRVTGIKLCNIVNIIWTPLTVSAQLRT